MSKRRGVGDSEASRYDPAQDDEGNGGTYDQPASFAVADDSELASRRIAKVRKSAGNAPGAAAFGAFANSFGAPSTASAGSSLFNAAPALTFGSSLPSSAGSASLPTFGAPFSMPLPGSSAPAPAPFPPMPTFGSMAPFPLISSVSSASSGSSGPSSGSFGLPLPVPAAASTGISFAFESSFGSGNKDSKAAPAPLPAFGGPSSAPALPITFSSNLASLAKTSAEAKAAAVAAPQDVFSAKAAPASMPVAPQPASVAALKPAPEAIVSSPAPAPTKPMPTSKSPVAVTNKFFGDVAELNRSFFEWVVRQYAEHPVSLWTDGLNDYLTFAASLAEEHGPVSQFYTKRSEARAPLALDSKPASDNLQPAAAKSLAVATPAKPAAAPVDASLVNTPQPTPAAKKEDVVASSFVIAPFSFPLPSAPAASTAVAPSAPAVTAPAPSAAVTAPVPAPSASFNFGSVSFPSAPVTTSAAAAPVSSLFSLPAAPAPAPAVTSAVPTPSASFNFGNAFSFGASAAPTPAVASVAPAIALPTSGGFASFAGFGASAPAVAAVPGNAAAAADSDDEPAGDPEDNVQTAARPATADGEELVYDNRAKVSRWSSDDNEWKDIGTGQFRMYHNKSTDKTRISFGASAGRTFLSAQLFKEMTVRRLQKANLEMFLFVDGKLQKYVCRVKTPEMADSLKVTLDKYKPK